MAQNTALLQDGASLQQIWYQDGRSGNTRVWTVGVNCTELKVVHENGLHAGYPYVTVLHDGYVIESINHVALCGFDPHVEAGYCGPMSSGASKERGGE